MTYEDKFFKISDAFYFNPLRELYKYRVYNKDTQVYIDYCTLWDDVPHYTIGSVKCIFCKNYFYNDYYRTNLQATYSNSYPSDIKYVLSSGSDHIDILSLNAQTLNIGFHYFTASSITDSSITFKSDYISNTYTFNKIYPQNGYILDDSNYYVNMDDDTDKFILDADFEYSKTPMLVGLYGFQMGK